MHISCRYWSHDDTRPQSANLIPIPHKRAVSDDQYTFICATLHSLFRPTPHAGARRHLPQAGQAVEDALRQTRQLVMVQRKLPVGMTDVSIDARRIQPDALCMPAVSP